MKTVMIILQLIPALIAAMKAVEESIPGTGKGEEKLAAIREIIEVTSEEAIGLWPTISRVIGILVAVFNKNNVFTK